MNFSIQAKCDLLDNNFATALLHSDDGKMTCQNLMLISRRKLWSHQQISYRKFILLRLGRDELVPPAPLGKHLRLSRSGITSPLNIMCFSFFFPVSQLKSSSVDKSLRQIMIRPVQNCSLFRGEQMSAMHKCITNAANTHYHLKHYLIRKQTPASQIN